MFSNKISEIFFETVSPAEKNDTEISREKLKEIWKFLNQSEKRTIQPKILEIPG